MAKEKKPQKDESTLITVSNNVNRYFKSVCVVHGLKPKSQLEKIMGEWAEQYAKKHGFGNLDQLRKV